MPHGHFVDGGTRHNCLLPEPHKGYWGSVWQCDECGRRWKETTCDYDSGYEWRKTLLTVLGKRYRKA